jgi:hypothetical protein
MAVLAFLVCVTMSFAQSPAMGAWKLNEAKSKIPAGAPKNTTVVYEAAGDNAKNIRSREILRRMGARTNRSTTIRWS